MTILKRTLLWQYTPTHCSLAYANKCFYLVSDQTQIFHLSTWMKSLRRELGMFYVIKSRPKRYFWLYIGTNESRKLNNRKSSILFLQLRTEVFLYLSCISLKCKIFLNVIFLNVKISRTCKSTITTDLLRKNLDLLNINLTVIFLPYLEFLI